MIEVDRLWNGLLLRLVKNSPISHSELKALNVDEFFKLLITHGEQVKEDKNKK